MDGAGVGAERHTVTSERLLAECEGFFQLCPPPEDLPATVQHAREFISHCSSERPIALVAVRFLEIFPPSRILFLVAIHNWTILLIYTLF